MERLATWRSPGGAVVVGGLLLTAAVVVVTVGAPVDYLSAPPSTSQPSPLTRPPATPTPTPSPPTNPWERYLDASSRPAWVELLLQLLVMLVAIAAAYLLFRVARYVPNLAGRRSKPAPVPHAAAVPPLPEVPEELIGARASRRRALLAEGEPRNAIVATWLDLEESLVASGLPPQPAETSREYAARVMTTWDVDVRAMADLADLYREARFSSHAMGPEQRDRALRDLDRVHSDIAAARGGRP